MPALTSTQKRFIVQQLACFRTPSEVAQAVNEEYDLTVTRQQVQRYDPEKVAGANLSKKLRALFAATREQFLADETVHAIAHRVFRLRELLELYRGAKSRGNHRGAAAYLEQAAKEVGGMYTNRRELTGADGGPVSGVFEVLIVDPSDGDPAE